MSFPRYPAYKDSGVEWLGEIPSHWETCALKRIVRMADLDDSNVRRQKALRASATVIAVFDEQVATLRPNNSSPRAQR